MLSQQSLTTQGAPAQEAKEDEEDEPEKLGPDASHFSNETGVSDSKR